MVYFVSDVVDQLNVSAVIESVYEEDDQGATAIVIRRMMTKILLYGYCVEECFRRARSRSDWWKTLPFACWRPVINQISGPSRIFGSCT